MICSARSIRSCAPDGIEAPVQESTTGVARSAHSSSTSGRSVEAEFTIADAPSAQAGSMASSPASSTAASDESIDSGTFEAGPTAATSQRMASSRPLVSGLISSTLRSR